MLPRWLIVGFYFFTLLWASPSASTSVAQNNDLRTSIDGTLDALIGLLKSQRFKQVMTDFVAPDELKQLLTRASLDAAVGSAIKNGDFERMLNACENARQVKPMLAPDGNLAVFKILDQKGKESTFGLRRVEGRWYLL